MKVGVFGGGYVGLVTGTCLAETGNHVVCVDTDAAKIGRLQRGEIPIYEPGLDTLIQKQESAGRLRFTTEAAAAVRESEILFIAVGTPPDEDGSADLRHVLAAAGTIADHMNGFKTIAVKSTVPVGTSAKVRQTIEARAPGAEFEVVSNPEFLKEGNAINDFMLPDRIVVGHETERGREVMNELYRPYIRTNNPILFMDNISAELTKYAANAFLAVKISFMNEIAGLCERVGADVANVRIGIGHDPRIGQKFLFPGAGYGGSCFPKDVKALRATANAHNCPLRIVSAAEDVNERQKRLLFEKAKAFYGGRLEGKVFAVWGLSFKPKTDDMREAPSITVTNLLHEAGAQVRAFDPEAMTEAKRVLDPRTRFFENAYRALEGADALMVLTEWNEFRSPDFKAIKRELRDGVVFDGRNIYDPSDIARHGIRYISIGRRAIAG